MITITLANNGEAQALDYALSKGKRGLTDAIAPAHKNGTAAGLIKQLSEHLNTLDKLSVQLKGLEP